MAWIICPTKERTLRQLITKSETLRMYFILQNAKGKRTVKNIKIQVAISRSHLISSHNFTMSVHFKSKFQDLPVNFKSKFQDLS